jgi:hypothetical protein
LLLGTAPVSQFAGVCQVEPSMRNHSFIGLAGRNVM